MNNLQNQVRIIAGKWRSRKLNFPAVQGLRPTPDRVRESLFNWLSPIILGANCLDLFAGSGALGFEALSRGAAQVSMVDKNLTIIHYLKRQQEIFATENIEIHLQSAIDFLQITPASFDIIFLDPPFQQNLIMPCCEVLQQRRLLNANARVYIEAESSLTALPVPSAWQLLKHKTAGQVGYWLFETN